MKTALITGYSTNIGRSITEKFIENGYEVIGVYCPRTRTNDRMMKNKYSCIRSFEADFTDDNAMTALLTELKKYRLDVIINNAGMLNLDSNGEIVNEFVCFNYSDFVTVMKCNFYAPLRLCLELKENMIPGGSIVNIASGGGMRASYATLSYAASKAALINLTKSLSNSFYPFYKIRVNSVSPGWVNPDESGAMCSDESSPGAKAKYLTPLGRNANTNEIASVVYFLATENASFVNGSNIVVDGGWLNHNVIYYEEAYGRSPI